MAELREGLFRLLLEILQSNFFSPTQEAYAVSSRFNVNVALSHPYIPATIYMEEPLYALLEVQPTAEAEGNARAPLNLALVIDSSATMHNFQLTPEDHEYWLGLAISRDETTRGEADAREAVYWSGQTLAEMQSTVRTPMALAVEAIKNLMTALRAGDKIAVIAFADRVHSIVSPQDWAAFPNQCPAQLDLLREQRLPINIGTGTFMAEALDLAGKTLRQMRAQQPGSINRLIVISDGIVQDKDAALAEIDAIQQEGMAITTLGVGDEFDEEFLTRVADNSRGEYHYAATTEEITERLVQEMASLQTTSATEVNIAVRGMNGALIQDMALVRPSMTLFDEIYTEGEWTRARIGDISRAAPAGVLIQIAPATRLEGAGAVAEVSMTWVNPGLNVNNAPGNQKIEISAGFSDDPARLAQVNPAVGDLVDRYAIYKFEREAQRAQEKGDLEKAREKMGAATRQLRKLGEDALAEDFEQQLSALGDASADPTRVKRIKATTRRLGSPPPSL